MPSIMFVVFSEDNVEALLAELRPTFMPREPIPPPKMFRSADV